MGKRGAQGNPGSPNSLFLRATTSKDSGVDSMSPTTAFWDGLEVAPLDISTHAVSLKDEGVGGYGQATDQ
jgi:hypothetical protein